MFQPRRSLLNHEEREEHEDKYFTFVLFVSFVVNEASWLARLRGLLLSALVQTKRRFEEESVNLHVNRIVDAHADDATDLLRNGK